VVIAIQKGERPRKPNDSGSLGLSDTLWQLTRMCWNEQASVRPAAQELLRCLQDASRTWIPPSTLQYPIPDGDGGGTGPDLTSGDERNRVVGAVASGFFVLVVGMLYFLLLPLT